MKERLMAEQNLVLKFEVGSRLYGTANETSDHDYCGVFIPTKDYVLGLHKCEEVDVRTNPSDSGHRNTAADVDCKYYSLQKFVHLLSGANPNIVELLFIKEPHLLFCNEFGQRLLDAAPHFLSRKVFFKFFGYATSQKQKLLTRNYEGSRREIVERYGWDVKFGLHLVRLLSEGYDLLTTGKLEFPLRNADYLLKIKTGQVSLDDVLAHVELLEKQFNTAYDTSPLPETPNLAELNKLQVSLFEDFWRKNDSRIPQPA